MFPDACHLDAPVGPKKGKTGSLELLMTLPVTTVQAVIGKFLAAWSFTAISLLLTFPIWITINYLGNPDNGVIVAAYIGSLLMAGGLSCDWIMHIRNDEKPSHCIYSQAVVVCFLFLISDFFTGA